MFDPDANQKRENTTYWDLQDSEVWIDWTGS